VVSSPPAGDRRNERRDRRNAAIADWAEPDLARRSLRIGTLSLDLRLVIGGLALAATAVQIMILPPGPVGVLTAAIATLALAADRRLGPLPAALLVALAIPWGRGADTLTWEVGGLPIRPHDAILGIGMLLAAPVLVRRRPRRGPTLVLLGALMVLGVVGVGVGIAADHPYRDIFRDVRWWAFYGAAILALFGATTRSQLLRGLLIGMSLFSAIVIVAALLPVFAGGLKEQELLYDRGTLRMQFGNSAFLVPAIAYVASAVLDRRRVVDVAWLLLLVTAVIVSLTRTSIAATLLVIGLVYVVDVVTRRGQGATVAAHAGGLARLALAGVVALGLGVGIDIAGTPPAGEVATSGGSIGEQPLDRIFMQEARSDLGSLEEGRFPSYRAAAARILAAPLTGPGMGSLTRVDYAYSDARANTIGYSPGVDNAYLTVGLKTGVPGMLVFAGLVLATLAVAIRRGGRAARWFVPAWLGLVILSMTQAFAGSLYGPYAFALLMAFPCLQWGASVWRRDGRTDRA
jgi:O-antigen ligase